MAGSVLNDRHLAGSVRRKALKEIEKILDGEDNDYKKQIVLKLAGTVLPRLNEVSGPDGEKLQIVVPLPVAEAFNIDATHTETGGSNKEQEPEESS